MKLVFALFDSLNRRSLEAYGAQTIKTPNFRRLAERCVTFDTHYVGSLPCMPARRDMQTGRLSFLHRSWGPLEPFDNAFPELLYQAGIYSHLISDHYHYWEDGGLTYHSRYDTYEFVRGQERDPWKAMVQPPWERLREKYHPAQFDDRRRSLYSHHVINREHIREEKDFPSVQCFDAGLRFLDTNREADDWLLQIETFDPHEPFFAPARFRDDYPTNYAGPIRDWPPYARVTEAPDECAELRANYCAIVALCDAQIGRLLDYFDRHDLWRDTALVVTTDHGFLLGEHDWWAKIRMPCYDEVAHIPLFFHHPGFAAKAGERRAALTQTIDIMPTILDLFGVASPREVEGRSLLPLLGDDKPIREGGEFNKMMSRLGVMVATPVLFLSSFLLMSALLYAVVALTGRKPEYHTLMSICVYAGFIELVGLGVRMAMILAYRTNDVNTSLAMLTEPGIATPLVAADPFRIWFWVLASLKLPLRKLRGRGFIR